MLAHKEQSTLASAQTRLYEGVNSLIVLSFQHSMSRGDGGTLGHGAHRDISIFGSFVVYQKLESLGWRASDITYHLL